MRRRYFLGLAAGRKDGIKQLFARGHKQDAIELSDFLAERYSGEVVLAKNGRSALALGLKAYFKEGDKILVNGFTCYAVYEAIKAAKMVPIFADISSLNLNFTRETLEAAMEDGVKGVIVQNSLGNLVDMRLIESFAKKYQISIIEDLAHAVGAKYPDGREVGTAGIMTALSFGKDKAIDATTGGAVVLRDKSHAKITPPSRSPRRADALRARFYPFLGILCRKLSYIHLGGVLMRALLKLKFVERSADSSVNLGEHINYVAAKIALRQLRTLPSDIKPLRKFYLVRDRAEVLRELNAAGYYFDSFWYEKPISPQRYYERVGFDELACPVATDVARKIVNLPSYYSEKELGLAKKIIKKYQEKI